MKLANTVMERMISNQEGFALAFFGVIIKLNEN